MGTVIGGAEGAGQGARSWGYLPSTEEFCPKRNRRTDRQTGRGNPGCLASQTGSLALPPPTEELSMQKQLGEGPLHFGSPVCP